MTAATAVTVVGALPLFLTAGLAVQIQSEMALTATVLGLTVAGYRGVTALSATPMGFLADKIGGRSAMRMAATISAGAAAAVAALAQRPLTLALSLAACGIANSLGQTGANLFMTTAVRHGRQGLAFGVKQAALPIATLLAGLAVPVFGLTVGWRWAYVASAILAVAVAISIPDTQNHPSVEPQVPVAACPPLRLLALAMALATAAASSLNTFLVHASFTAGVPEGAAGLLLTFGGLLAVIARVASGHYADRRTSGHLRIVAGMLALGATGYVLLSSQIPLLIVGGVILTFGMGWGYSGVFWLAVVRISPGGAGAATGKVMTASFAGAVVGPIGFGAIVDATSYSWAWSFTGCVTAVSALLMYRSRAGILSYLEVSEM